MTSEQAPTAGIEAAAWIVSRWDRDGVEHHYLPFLRTFEEMQRYRQCNPDETLAALYSAASIEALRAQIAALEDQVRSARADAWREGRDAAALFVENLAGEHARIDDADIETAETLSAVAAGIRAINPPESSNAAS